MWNDQAFKKSFFPSVYISYSNAVLVKPYTVHGISCVCGENEYYYFFFWVLLFYTLPYQWYSMLLPWCCEERTVWPYAGISHYASILIISGGGGGDDDDCDYYFSSGQET